jgi:DNA-binding beta-propeller fold protein YncE
VSLAAPVGPVTVGARKRGFASCITCTLLASACGTTPEIATLGGQVGLELAGASGGGAAIDSSNDEGAVTAEPIVEPLPPAVVHWYAGVEVSTIAGSANPAVAVAPDGPTLSAKFNNPTGVVLDTDGSLLITEFDGGRLRRLHEYGVASTIVSAGSLVGPFGLSFLGDHSLIVETDFDEEGLKSTTSGALHRIKSDGTITLIVGGLGRPRGLALLADDNVVVADRMRHTISVLKPAQGTLVSLAGERDQSGFVNGTGKAARFDSPIGVVAMADGSTLVADSENHCIRRVLADGTVFAFAGNGQRAMIDGPRLEASFARPVALARDAIGNVYVTDTGTHRIRRIALDGTVETLAGDGEAGFADGPGISARFYGLEGIAVSSDGHTVYIADGNLGDGSPYHRIRKLTIP